MDPVYYSMLLHISPLTLTPTLHLHVPINTLRCLNMFAKELVTTLETS